MDSHSNNVQIFKIDMTERFWRDYKVVFLTRTLQASIFISDHSKTHFHACLQQEYDNLKVERETNKVSLFQEFFEFNLLRVIDTDSNLKSIKMCVYFFRNLRFFQQRANSQASQNVN